MKRSKSWRIWKERCVINKRIKLVKWFDPNDYRFKDFEKEKHRLTKKCPYDCGCSKCYLCHSNKLLNEKNIKDIRRSQIELDDDFMSNWSEYNDR